MFHVKLIYKLKNNELKIWYVFKINIILVNKNTINKEITLIDLNKIKFHVKHNNRIYS